MQNGWKKVLVCLLAMLMLFGTVPDLHFISSALSGNQVVEEARKYIGKPYQSGAKGPDSFDCSGLVYYVFSQLGETVQTGSTDGYDSQGIRVDEADVQVGDLVLWYPTAPGRNDGHVGICSGNGKYISALVNPYGVMEDLITNYNNGTKNPPHHYVRLNCLTTHVHDYSSLAYYQDEHPHYAVYQCSCGQTQVSTETHVDPACEQCVTVSGTCGDNVVWSLNTTTGVLTISGTGAMRDFDSYTGSSPWYSYRNLIKYVTIGNGVTSISGYAFANCTGLASVTIPDSVTTIGDSAFWCCSSLTSVTIPDSVTSIGHYVFYSCRSLASVAIGNSVTTIGYYAFYECTSLTSVTIPDSVTGIGDYAFWDCTSLASIIIPDSVTGIGDYAFRNCKGLTSVTIPDSVTSISNSAFSGCTGLTSVTIPDSVTTIGSNAFYDCKGLTSVTIPDSVTSIGGSAFWYCTGLTSVTIPDSVTSIGNSVFSGCTGLTSVMIGSSVTSIGKWAFNGCTSLTSVTIPDSVTTIGDDAFCDCTSLTSVTIPDSVTSIGYWAFSGCKSLTDVYYGGSESDRQNISIGTNNQPLLNAAWHYNSAGLNVHTHAYVSEVTTAPTCTADGVRTYTCTACGDSYTEGIEKKTHTPQDVTEPATCMKEGKQYTVCSVCGETLGEVAVLPMLDHDFGEWVTVKEATIDDAGMQERACRYNCGTKETQELPKIPSTTIEDGSSGITLTYPDSSYDGKIELKIEQLFDGAAFNLVDLNSDQNAVFDITTVKDGVTVQPNGKVRVRIPVPEGFDPAKCMVYHVSTGTGKLEKMNARYEDGYMVFETDHFSVYALVIEKTLQPDPVITIHNYTPSRTVDYRTTITFSVDEIQNPVDGASVHWFINGQDKGASDTYTVKEAKATYTVQAKYMKDGDVLAESEIETVNVKTGFFARLKAFFRALFGRLPKVVQEYLGVEIIDRVLP